MEIVPGRKVRANGRRAALEVLDNVMSNAVNMQALKKDMQKEFEADPTAFFLKVVLPCMPKEMLLNVDEDDELAKIEKVQEFLRAANFSMVGKIEMHTDSEDTDGGANDDE